MKILITILFCVFFCYCNAQTFPITTAIGGKTVNTRTEGTFGSFTGFTFAKNYSDTADANSSLYVKFTPGIVIRTGDTIFWVRNQATTYWTKISGGGSGGGGSGFTTANNGLTNNTSSNVQLGGTVLSQYTAIPLNGFPLNIVHDGVNNANRSDSNAISLRNNSVASSTTDSLISPMLRFYSSGRKTLGGAAGQPIAIEMDLLGTSGSTSPTGLFRWFSVRNTTRAQIFSMTTTGVIPDPLNLNGARIGSTVSTSVFFGSGAGTTSGGGINAVAIGANALTANSSGTDNTAVGFQSMATNTTGNFNTAFGDQTLGNNNADLNTAVGYSAMEFNTSGTANTAIGTNALTANTTGIKNTSVGAGSMENTTIGGFNTVVGEDALLHNITGTNNIAIGWLSGALNTSGTGNISIGFNTGTFVASGDNNTFIGTNAGNLSPQEDTLSESIAVGHNAVTTASNQMVLGSTNILQTKIFGSRIGSISDSVYTRRAADGTLGAIAMSSIIGATPTLQKIFDVEAGTAVMTSDNTIDVGSHEFLIFSATANFIDIGSAGGLTLSSPGGNLGLAAGAFNIAITSPVQLGGEPTGIIDTINNKPAAISNSGILVRMNSWAQVSGGSSITAGFGLSGTTTFIVDTTKILDKLVGTNISGAMQFTSLLTARAGINLTGTTSPLQVGGSAGTSGYVLTSAGAGATPTWSPASSFALTNGNGTTANGTAVDLGGTLNASVDIDGSFPVRFGFNSPITDFFVAASGGDVNISGDQAFTLTSNVADMNLVSAADIIVTPASRFHIFDVNTSSATTGFVFTLADPTTGEGRWTAPAACATCVTAASTLTSNALMIGGGTRASSTTTTGTGVLTALGINVGSAGAFVTFNGALGTPTSATLTNATGYLWNNLVDPTGTQTLSWPDASLNAWTNGSNTETFTTITSNSLTTGIVLSMLTNSQTFGILSRIGSTSTAKVTGNALSVHVSSGANAGNSVVNLGDSIAITNTGTTSVNIGMKVIASGGATNYAALFTGSVGINTSAPLSALDVSTGTISAGAFTTLAASAFVGNFLTGATAGSTSSTSASLLYLGASNAALKVMVNGSNTASTLTAGHVYSTFEVGNSAITEATSGTHPGLFSAVFLPITITNGTATTTNIGTVYISGPPTGITSTNARTSLWVDNGMVQIDDTLALGTAAPSAQLHTTGTVRMSLFGAGAATFDANGNISSVSDGRLKNIIRPYEAGLNELMKFTPIVYTWKPESGMETKHEYAGLDARQVHSVLGDLGTGINSQGYYSIQDRSLIVMLINSVQQQQKEIEELKRRIK